MPPLLALFISLSFILWLLKRELDANAAVSRAVWIPVAWMSIIGSRFVSEWFNTSGLDSPDAFLEGSPLDKIVFLALILLGISVLLKRDVSWQLFFENNKWVTAFFLYAALSILWSDFPLTAFKRWYKVVGHVIMVLVVLSEQEPVKAIQTLFRRCGYILILLSVVLIKYYPSFGRGFSFWSGEAINMGVTTDKNALGNLCVVFALFFVSSLFLGSGEKKSARRLNWYIDILFLCMVGWLLNMAHSANSLACTILGTLVILLTRIRAIARHLSPFILVTSLVLVILELSFHLRDVVILSLGRDLTLTGRTGLWEALQQIKINPWIGVGFESFWLGDRAAKLWDIFWWKPNQAHNGYYETYLNLGLIGLCLQCGMMFSCYLKIRKRMLETVPTRLKKDRSDFVVAQFGMAFLIALAFYNTAEATFKALHLSFFVFFLVAIQYPLPQESEVRVRDQLRDDDTLIRRRRLPSPG